MRLSNWLYSLRTSRRIRTSPVRQLRRNPALQRVEQLESRLCLSGSAYATAGSDWFGSLETTLLPAAGLTGTAFSGPVPQGVIAHQYLVRLTPEATRTAGSLDGSQALIAGGSVDLQVSSGLGLAGQVLVATSEWDSVRVVEAMAANPAIAYFEEDFTVGASLFPNEQTQSAEFPRQYGLHNTGQTGGVADADIDAPEAWETTVGSTTTVVSVIDSGVDFTHPDLYLNIWLNQGELPPLFAGTLSDVDNDGLITFRDLNDAANGTFVTDLNANGYIDAEDLLDDPQWADGIDTDGNGFEDDLVGWDFFEDDNRPFDEHRHGTHVAGILGGIGDNSFGIAGVNWAVSMMPLRFLDEDNKGDVSNAIEAINYTTMMRTRDEAAVNLRVSNNSWGASGASSQALRDAVAGNLTADILFVAAAGNGDVLGQGINNDQTPFFPASVDLPNVISVAAVNDRGELATFSNFGTRSVDIVAPGVDIVSTEPGGTFISRSGTSMATPHVSGAAALVFDIHPEATAVEVRDAILTGADTRGALADRITAGRSLNAAAALTASTFAPVPELVAIPSITTTGVVEVSISVKYTDDNAVDTSTFDIRDIEITRDGFSQTLLQPFAATTTTIDSTDAAIYRVAAPGGEWDATENGIWTVRLREGEIRDNEGLYSAPRALGTFEVNIDDPNVIFVNTTADTVDANLMDGIAADTQGNVSLRAAIMHANSVAAPTTIVLPEGVYTLVLPGNDEDAAVTGDLDLTSNDGITITGSGAFNTTIDAQQLDRVFDIDVNAVATIQGVTIRNGNAEQGGGIQNAGTLTLQESLVTGNQAEAVGGGIFNLGFLFVSDSSIENNQTTDRFFGLGGGGIAVLGTPGTPIGQTQITRSSIVNNTASLAGGGLAVFDADLVLDRVTVHGNVAQRGDGGGILLRTDDPQKLHLLSSITVTQNSAPAASGGGLSADAVAELALVTNTIIAENLARTSPDVEGRITSDGTSLFGQPSNTSPQWRTLSPNATDFDQIGTAQSPLNPQLTALQPTTGVVQTRTPLPDGRSSNSMIASVAEPALRSGLPVVYSTAELEPNDSRTQAMQLDDRGWSLEFHPDITNSTTIPHVTITGTGDGTFDYYSFTVPQAGATALFDIDSDSIDEAAHFDTKLFLFDSSGALLTTSDDNGGDSGSMTSFPSLRDARVEHTFSVPGYYAIAIGRSDSFVGSDGHLAGHTPLTGSGYVLHVSVDGHQLARPNYNPASPAQLTPVTGTDKADAYLLAARQGTDLYEATQTYPVGEYPEAVALGDVNGDGILDAVSANSNSSTVSVLVGLGASQFLDAVHYPVGDSLPSGVASVVLNDVNGDGILDILTANSISDDVSVLLGNGDGSFQTAVHYAAGDAPIAVAVGDVNADRVPDLIIGNGNSGGLSILIGNGNGTFQLPLSDLLGGSYRSVLLADVNNDGTLDIVAADVSSFRVRVLTNDGNGEFLSLADYSIGSRPEYVAASDVTGDGNLDIVVAVATDKSVRVLPSVGEGLFGPSVRYDAGDGPFSLVIGDVTGDRIADIITSNSNNNSVSVINGRGDGTFAPAVVYQTGNVQFVALGDVSGDGFSDIVVANGFDNQVGVLTADGDGTFPNPPTYTVEDRPEAVSINDLNNDGIADLVIANISSDRVSIFLGTGGGQFQTAASYGVGRSPNSIVTGDFNGDGLRDIATANGSSDDVSVLIGNGDGTVQPARHFTVDLTPDSVSVGDINDDGLLDLGTVHFQTGRVSLLIGKGDGTFQDVSTQVVGSSASALSLNDATGDGISDIATVSFGTVRLRAGNGDGTFQDEISQFIGAPLISVAVEDATGDGIVDIVSTSSNGNVYLLAGTGAGGFGPAVAISVGGFPGSVAIGDLSGDGVPDVVTANFNSEDVSILVGDGAGGFMASLEYAIGDNPTAVAIGDVTGDGVLDTVTADNRGSASILRGNGNGTVQPPESHPLSGTSARMTLADINGDSIIDVLTVGGGSDSVTIQAGNGDGTFQTGVSYFAGDRPEGAAFGDVTGDGIGDIVSVNLLDNELSVLEGAVDGSFERTGAFFAGSFPQQVILEDVNSDGDLDAVTMSGIADTVGVLLGNGDGTFQAWASYSVGEAPRSLLLRDVSGDGVPDVVTANSATDDLSVLLGIGNGTFQSAVSYAVGDNPASVAVADLDGDSFLDLVTANEESDDVTVLSGNGDGTFRTAVSFRAGDGPSSVALTDMDGDRDVDIAVTALRSNDISILLGDGTGAFQKTASYAVGRSPGSIQAGDLNGDGASDLAALTSLGRDVSILLGTPGVVAKLSETEDLLERLPTRGVPTLLTEHGNRTWWVTSDLDSQEIILWSGHSDQGVREELRYAPRSLSDVPTDLKSSGPRLILLSQESVREYDPATSEFTLTAPSNGTFDAPINYPTGDSPRATVVDITGDGILDVVTANLLGGSVSVLAGGGDGRFSSAGTFFTGSGPASVAAGDITGDGILDLVTANAFGDSVSVLMGTGNGQFMNAVSYPIGNNPQTAVLRDTNNDGFLDIVAANRADGTVSVLIANSDGSYQSADTYVIENGQGFTVLLESAITGDVTGDGIADIITANGSVSSISVLVGNGDGTFQEHAEQTSGFVSPEVLSLTDVSGDGIADLVIANGINSNEMSVAFGNGDGTFQTAINYAAGDGVDDVAVGDVTGDGIPDVVAANTLNDDVSVFAGKGDGTFQAAVNYVAGDSVSTVSLADVTGDGAIDLITGNSGSDSISVLAGRSRVLSTDRVGNVTVIINEAFLLARPDGGDGFQPLQIADVDSAAGPLRQADYRLVRTAVFEDQLLALVEITGPAARRGDAQLLLISPPEFDPDTGEASPVNAENLTLNTSLRLIVTDDDGLFVDGDRIYLSAEIKDAEIGSELLAYDRTSGLRLVGDLLPGSAGSQPRDFAAASGHVFFTGLTSRSDAADGTQGLQRELFLLDPFTSIVQVVRSGVEVTGAPSASGSSVVFSSRLRLSAPEQLWSFDTSQSGVPPIGAYEAVMGDVSGVVFLDRNGDGQRDSDEPGRAGVTLYVDLNKNGRREAAEPTIVSRFDDPGTAADETGEFLFVDLPAGNYQIRSETIDGFVQTSPVTILSGAPTLAELASDSIGMDSAFGLPSIVGDDIVFVDRLKGELIRQQVGGDRELLLDLQTVIPDAGAVVQSIGTSHSQDGDSVVFTVALLGGRELVATLDARGQVAVFADTGSNLVSIPQGGTPESTTLVDIEDGLNGGFDSLSIADGVVGFLGETDGGDRNYYLGDGEFFAEFAHGQAILDGDNEIFVDRVVEETEEKLTGADLFLEKATLDAQIGGTTGWTITTRTGEVILPLTFFDRVFDVSVSGETVAFRALDAAGAEGLYAASSETGLTKLLSAFVDLNQNGVFDVGEPPGSEVPGGVDFFASYGSRANRLESPSLALEGERIAFVGQTLLGFDIGLYAVIDGETRTIVDGNTEFGGRTLSDLAISHQAISGNQVVFKAVFADGTESIYQATLPAEPFITVDVPAGGVVTGVNFGASADPGAIRGVSFTDTVIDGALNRGESGNAGRTVFLDENLNGVLDDDERSAVTDEDGRFAFFDLPAEQSYVIREVLPAGVGSTTQQSVADATIFVAAASTVEVNLGSVDLAALGESADGVVTGVIFSDANGNGMRDDVMTEPGIGGVTVFVDENGDGELNGGERSSTTNPDGSYTIDRLRGIAQDVRIVLPNGRSEQTNALGNSFATQKVQTTDAPAEAATVDVDGDEDLDLLVSVINVGELRVLINDGNGQFTSAESLRIGGSPDVVTPLRIAGESVPSAVVAAHPNLQRVDLVRPGVDPGDGSGFTLTPLVRPSDLMPGGILDVFAGTPFIPRGIVAADFNGDGFEDVAVAVEQAPGSSGGAVVVYRGNMLGAFTHEQTLFLDEMDVDTVAGIAVGAFADGLPVSLVVTGFSSDSVAVLSNSGSMGIDANRFSVTDTLAVGGRGPASVQIADLNGDGSRDIVTGNTLSGSVTLLQRDPNGTFDAARQFSAGTFPAAVNVEDLDGDDRLDILFTVLAGTDRIGILRNLGNVGPAGRVEFEALETSGVAVLPDGTTPFSLTVAQLDDGDTPDVVVTLRRDPSLQINAENAQLGLNTVNVALNSVVPGGLNVTLPNDTREAAGLNFGVQTLNLPPTIGDIADPPAIPEDSDEQTVPVTGITTGGEVESLTVTVSSDNAALIDPEIDFDAGTGTATIIYTPESQMSGTATLTVTVQDRGKDGIPGNADDGIAAKSFLVSVFAVDDPAPTGLDESFTVFSGVPSVLSVLANEDAANPDVGEPIVLTGATAASGGQITLSSEFRTMEYLPAIGFAGEEVIEYSFRVGDDPQTATARSATATVTVNAVDLVVPESDDGITVFAAGGLVVVERNGAADAAFDGIPAAAVRSISVSGGAGSSRIDLAGVTAASFTFPDIQVSVNAGDGDDLVFGSGFPDTLRGEAGNDSLFGNGGNDLLEGNAGDDSALGASGDDVLRGGDGSDILKGSAGKDSLDGGSGNDMLFGQGTAGDSLTGGPGADELDGGSGGDFVREVSVIDTGMQYELEGNQLVLRLADGTLVERDTLVSLERGRFTGGRGDDRIDVTAARDAGLTEVTVNGAIGRDTLIGSSLPEQLLGGGGNDLITSGNGFDRLLGGSGKDRLIAGDGNNRLAGGNGDDTLTGSLGNDTIDGGSGIDWLLETADVNFVLTPTSLTGLGTDRLKRVENASLTGGDSGNLFNAAAFNTGRVVVFGLGGDDSILGSTGDDRLEGGPGFDTIFGLAGNDSLNGGESADLLIGGEGNDALSGAQDSVAGDADTDTLVGGTGDGGVQTGDTFDDFTERIDDFFLTNPLPTWADSI